VKPHLPLALCVVWALTGSVAADPAPAGSIVVDGRALSVSYYKVDGKLWLPILDVARAEGRDVTWSDSHLNVNGSPSSITVLVVHDAPCVAWIDLQALLPGVQVGMRGDQVVFSKAAGTPVAKASNAPVQVVNSDNPGQTLDIQDSIVPGKYTVLEFYSDQSEPCQNWTRALTALVTRRRDMVVRQFNINRTDEQDDIDFDSPLAVQYHIDTVPHFVLYDPHGKALGEDFSFTTNELIRWMRAAGMSEAEIKRFDLY
jgi:hypothetical protein